jgi:RluA family pseudouridine synthase
MSEERLLEKLAERVPGASRRTLRQLLVHGRVLVDGVVVRRGDVPVGRGARIVVLPKEATAGGAPPIPIVHEDAGIVVVDKPPGLLTVSTRAERRPSAWSALRRHLRERGRRETVDLVHRLDEYASGLLVFAKSEQARRKLKEIFAAHDVDRRYAAIVSGRLPGPGGELRSRLLELGGRLHKVRSLRPSDGPRRRASAREAITRYRTLATKRDLSAMEVRLETGRKHQIRVQFAEAGHPILGDRLYGGAPAQRLHLHAWVLAFKHPVSGEEIRVVSPPEPAFDERVPGAFEAPGP